MTLGSPRSWWRQVCTWGFCIGCSQYHVHGVIHLYRRSVDSFDSWNNIERYVGFGLVENALHYRACHMRVNQGATGIDAELRVSYETTSDGIDDELLRVLRCMGVEPLKLDELLGRFSEDWHLIGYAKLMRLDGLIARKSHGLPGRIRRWIHCLAGRQKANAECAT